MPLAVNVCVLPVVNASAVVVAEKPLAKVIVLPYADDSTGAVAPPKVSDRVLVPLKLMVPALVTLIVPLALPKVTELLKFKIPVLTLITSVLEEALLIQVMVPSRLNVPELCRYRTSTAVRPISSLPRSCALPCARFQAAFRERLIRHSSCINQKGPVNQKRLG